MTDKTASSAPNDVSVAIDENALFEHLQELVDMLPHMQEKGERLAKARSAREVARLERYHKGQENELRSVQKEFEAQLDAEEAAKAAGDSDAQVRARYNVLNLGNQLGIRRGAEADAVRKVDKALFVAGFASVEEAERFDLDDAAFSELEQEVESFKADYAKTLEACQAIAGEEE